MSKPRLVDTNLIVRHLVQDHEQHSAAAGRLFDACDRGEIEIVVLPAVLAECVFVLESFYQHPRPAIADALSALIASPGIRMHDLPVQLDALARYRAGKAHFVDCVIAAAAGRDDIAVASFDRDFKTFTDVRIDTDPA